MTVVLPLSPCSSGFNGIVVGPEMTTFMVPEIWVKAPGNDIAGMVIMLGNAMLGFPDIAVVEPDIVMPGESGCVIRAVKTYSGVSEIVVGLNDASDTPITEAMAFAIDAPVSRLVLAGCATMVGALVALIVGAFVCVVCRSGKDFGVGVKAAETVSEVFARCWDENVKSTGMKDSSGTGDSCVTTGLDVGGTYV